MFSQQELTVRAEAVARRTRDPFLRPVHLLIAALDDPELSMPTDRKRHVRQQLLDFTGEGTVVVAELEHSPQARDLLARSADGTGDWLERLASNATGSLTRLLVEENLISADSEHAKEHSRRREIVRHQRNGTAR